METKEFEFKGAVLNGFLMFFVNLAMFVASIILIIMAINNEGDGVAIGFLELGFGLALLVPPSFVHVAT